MFNPETFLNEQQQAGFSTDLPSVPAGTYQAFISDRDNGVTAKASSKGNPMLVLQYVVDDTAVKEETGLDRPTVPQFLVLDLTPEGKLAQGKSDNIGLGQLLDILDMNAGDFKPADLKGRGPVRIIVDEITREDGSTMSTVKRVIPLETA